MEHNTTYNHNTIIQINVLSNKCSDIQIQILDQIQSLEYRSPKAQV
jgi:hypothetical protein